MVPKALKLMSRSQVWLYRRTGGRIGGKWRVGSGWRKPVPTLLLDHRGRRSGRIFTTPLLFITDGPDVVVVASQGGLPKHPQWYHNLLANPDTEIQLRADAAVPYGRVVEIMGAAHQAGLQRIGFVSEPATAGAPAARSKVP